jgi:hypothetical protein
MVIDELADPGAVGVKVTVIVRDPPLADITVLAGRLDVSLNGTFGFVIEVMVRSMPPLLVIVMFRVLDMDAHADTFPKSTEFDETAI